MKNITKKLLSFSLAVLILISLFCLNTFAAGTIIAFSKNSVVVGDTLSMTITLDAGEAMYGVGCVINYDAAKFQYVSGASNGGAGTLQIIESPSGDTKVSYTLSFKALASGSGSFSVVDCRYESLTESKSLGGASASVSVTDAALSGNANLSALSVSSGKLSPAFSADRTSYTVYVSNSVSDFTVYATAADSGATVKVPSTTQLKIGSNPISVVVTAANGTQKTYTITAIRSEAETPSEEEPENEELEIDIDGVKYTLADDLSDIELLTGFSEKTTQYKETEVTIATDEAEEFKLFYLIAEDSDEAIPFIYNEDDDSFVKALYITRNDKDYIICTIPEDKYFPDDYFLTNTTLDTLNLKCLSNNSSEFEDFYYFYCYFNGKYGFYCYDTVEDTLQRFPQLKLADVPVNAPQADTDEEELPDGFFARFLSLTTNAKIIVVSIVVILLCVIILIILFVVKLISSRNKYDDGSAYEEYDYEDDFDDVYVSGDEYSAKPHEQSVPDTEEEDDLVTEEK